MKLCSFRPLRAACILALALIQISAFGQAQTHGSWDHHSDYRWKNVKIVAGWFITGIIPHPTSPGIAYVRTDIGGAYRFDAFSKKWTPLTDLFNQNDWNLTGTESIAVDPVDPARLYLAQGTYTESWAGNGVILPSRDFGFSFDRVPLPIQLGSNEPGRYSGERLAVDPQHHNVLYFGSRNNGLWKSADFGATWNQVTSFPVTGPTSGVGVIFVDFQPTSQKPKKETIYVGVSDATTGLIRDASRHGGAGCRIHESGQRHGCAIRGHHRHDPMVGDFRAGHNDLHADAHSGIRRANDARQLRRRHVGVGHGQPPGTRRGQFRPGPLLLLPLARDARGLRRPQRNLALGSPVRTCVLTSPNQATVGGSDTWNRYAARRSPLLRRTMATARCRGAANPRLVRGD